MLTLANAIDPSLPMQKFIMGIDPLTPMQKFNVTSYGEVSNTFIALPFSIGYLTG